MFYASRLSTAKEGENGAVFSKNSKASRKNSPKAQINLLPWNCHKLPKSFQKRVFALEKMVWQF